MIPSHRKKSKSNRTFLLAARGKNVFKIGTLTAFFIAKSGYDFANPERYHCRKTVWNARMISDFFVWLSILQYLMKKRSTCPETFIETLDTVFSLRTMPELSKIIRWEFALFERILDHSNAKKNTISIKIPLLVFGGSFQSFWWEFQIRRWEFLPPAPT